MTVYFTVKETAVEELMVLEKSTQRRKHWKLLLLSTPKAHSDKIIVEFQNEADLFNACDKNYHFSDFNVKGYPLVDSHETATNQDDDSKEKVNNKPHIQGQHVTFVRHTHRHQKFKNNHNSKKSQYHQKNIDYIPSCASGSNKLPLGVNLTATTFDTSSTHSNTPNNQNRQEDWDELMSLS
ncbi:unnamed protein product [Rhizophagus irregularis]|nr:unnamed protein product [Rhizophagus irregularis]CAB4417828.1 unnamed protein product [Rhizophagus irregularis]